ncbi:MAG: hypothetical protein QXS69_00605 [Candidatus Aenigmatarchaeota archaeon]
MLEIFKERKKIAIRKLLDAIKNKEVDQPIEKELLRLNEYEIVYSTSSCSGRIALLVDKGNKKDSYFIAKWHKTVAPKDVIESLKKDMNHELIFFKQEPFIIHLVFPKLRIARDVLTIAREVGFKHSGIISMKKEKIVLEITGLERIDFPIVINSELVISLENFSKIVDLANSKLVRNEKMRNVFFSKLFEYLDKNYKSCEINSYL